MADVALMTFCSGLNLPSPSITFDDELKHPRRLLKHKVPIAVGITINFSVTTTTLINMTLTFS
jgi:hypothetical protein